MKFPPIYLDRSRSITTFIKTSLLLAIFGYLVASSNQKVIAQIVPDRTLPNNSVVNVKAQSRAINTNGKIQLVDRTSNLNPYQTWQQPVRSK
jgi:hypothetical protein